MTRGTSNINQSEIFFLRNRSRQNIKSSIYFGGTKKCKNYEYEKHKILPAVTKNWTISECFLVCLSILFCLFVWWISHRHANPAGKYNRLSSSLYVAEFSRPYRLTGKLSTNRLGEKQWVKDVFLVRPIWFNESFRRTNMSIVNKTLSTPHWFIRLIALLLLGTTRTWCLHNSPFQDILYVQSSGKILNNGKSGEPIMTNFFN